MVHEGDELLQQLLGTHKPRPRGGVGDIQTSGSAEVIDHNVHTRGSQRGSGETV